MRRDSLYHGSLGLAGASIGAVGLADLSGGMDLSAVLMVLGGLGTAIAAVYGLLKGSGMGMDEHPMLAWLAAGAAALALAGAMLLLAS